ncbi:GntR family transcriptional regulator [Devosia sediminis]|uniref:GntR family transcriptional regulator n=1 Tax=Devosia sediminis TaxID=2798801 RepID=A0A934MFR1_9HYPH|nr:GntR family transcriptional regulator [Devosia sediminis]MBJ3783107.1 GntR family transcriptional regulator [Devosia sediminis]
MTKTRKAREHLLERIKSMKANELLPRERDLALELDISRSGLRQALSELENERVIYRVRGKGTYVSDKQISKHTFITSFTRDMIDRGLVAGTRVLSRAQALAVGDVARDLDVPDGTLIYSLQRLRLADSEPMCIENVQLPAELFPDLLREDLDTSLYNILQSRYGIEIAFTRQTIRAIVASAEQRRLLGTPRTAALLEVTRINFDARHRPIERGVSIYRGDRYDFTFNTNHQN